MFYGVPGGLSGSQWGTQDSNGVWSGMNQSAPSFGGAPVNQPINAPSPTYDTGASFGGAPVQQAPQAPNMGQYLRSLDWSPNNAFNATQQMQQAMGQYGWTPDQVGAELGFTGDQMNAHLNKYGSMGGYLRSLDWSPQNASNATRQMVQAMGQYGWTPAQVGKELGFSGADMLNHIYRYGGMGGGAGGAQAGLGTNQPVIADTRMGMPDSMYGGSRTFNGGPGGLGGAYQPGIANDPMGGGSVGANPYMGSQIGYLSDVMGRALQRNLQGIRSNAVGTGNLGSSRQGIAEGEAFRGFADALGGNVANMLGQNYQFDRSLNTGSYNTNRALDLQQAGLGLNAMNQGLGMQWSPLMNANSVYTPYTGLGSQSTPGQGGGWQGVLGGGLAAAQLANNFGWFK